MENFTDVWNTLSIFNTIPATVTEEIDILTGASQSFINMVAELERMTDLNQRAQTAEKYIKDNHGLTEIEYTRLGSYLSNIKSTNIVIWRQLYMLERSIPPRFGNKYSWVQRLKIFYNTFLHETNIISNATKINGKRLYFIKGSAKNPTNHDKLVCGKGHWGADFYFFDDTITGQTRDKMVKVEFKYCTESTPEYGAKKYLNGGNYSYNANYIVLYMPNEQKYYVATYENNEYNITLLDLAAPSNTFDL